MKVLCGQRGSRVSLQPPVDLLSPKGYRCVPQKAGTCSFSMAAAELPPWSSGYSIPSPSAFCNGQGLVPVQSQPWSTWGGVGGKVVWLSS